MSAIRSGRIVAVLGGAGRLGSRVLQRLVAAGAAERLVSIDLESMPDGALLPGVEQVQLDVRSAELTATLRDRGVECVVHLAATLVPSRRLSVSQQYSEDVDGAHNVLESCVEAQVAQLIAVSSGAAYGYHADSPPVLEETAPLRGNDDFPYARHKRLVEELLARYRTQHPEVRQLVLRTSMVVGSGLRSPLVSAFDRGVVFGVRGAQARFDFIHEQDLVEVISRGVQAGHDGIFNVSADGSLAVAEIAEQLRVRYVEMSARALRRTLRWCCRFGLSGHGPELVQMMEHRRVLSNRALKTGLGYEPRYTSREAFSSWASTR
jgi:UDP-glucose 4-epimerase